MKYLLAHDLGTSGDKATLFSTDGELIASSLSSYDTHYFNSNWAEQNAEDWWNAFCASTSSLIRKSGIDPQDISGISFSGQMMGCLCVDRAGDPLRPAIIWADMRAREEAAGIAAKISLFDYYKVCGHRISQSYGLYKFMWIQKNEPEIYEQTYKTLNAKDFIVLKLTGTFCTDHSDANGCGFFDLTTLDWSVELLSHTDIDRNKLPDVHPSTFIAGTVTDEASEKTGLAKGTPVIIGAGDGVASNVGAGSITPGKTFCCLGTSAWITTTAEEPLIDPQMRTVTWAHMIPGLYAPNGTMQYAGGSLSWLKHTLFPDISYDDINTEAAKSSPGSGGLTFLPYLIGERAPRWDDDAKGCFIGLTPQTSKGDLIRSVLEGVACNLGIILDVLRGSIDVNELTLLGGGAKSSLWQQIMADIYDARILVPAVLEEAGSMGAAVCAGVGTGVYKDFSAVDRFLKISSVREPGPDVKQLYKEVKERFDRYYSALKGSW